MSTTDALLRSVTLYLSELDQQFGNWQVAEDDTLHFEEHVSDGVITELNQNRADMLRLSEELQQLSQRILKSVTPAVR